MFISTFAKRVEIHCYDAHEVETEETIDGHVKVVAHDKLYNGDGHEFDVLIDDAFVPNVGVPLAKYVSRVRTLKRHFPTTEDGCDSVRFLHDMEHRLFFFLHCRLQLLYACVIDVRLKAFFIRINVIPCFDLVIL